MLEVIVLVVGIAIGAGVQRFLSRRAAPPADSGPESAPPAAAPSTAGTAAADEPPGPKELTARLQSFRESLTSIVSSSAHPREIADREELRQAAELLADSQVSADIVVDYAFGAHTALACAAFVALGQRKDGETAATAVLARLPHLDAHALYFALQYLASVSRRPPVGAAVASPGPYWDESPLAQTALAAYFRKRDEQGDAPTFGNALDAQGNVNVDSITGVLKTIDHPFSVALLAELRAWQKRTVNRSWLASVGRFWTREDEDLLIEYEAIRETLLTAETAVRHVPPRSLLIVGEPRSGKTAFVRLLARHLAAEGYAVFEAGAAELMAGQKYIGELEGRIKQLVGELTADKRVIWYIPEFMQIVTSGRHSGQAASILDQIMPAIAAGRVIVIGECTPGVLVKMHQLHPALRNAVDLVRLRAVSAAEAAVVANEFVQRLERVTGLTAEPAVVPTSMQLAAQYLGGLQLPGAVLDLLKTAANRAAANDEEQLTREGVLDTLSQVTSLPRAILDDREKTDLASVRAFFTTRVIGQQEAVDAIVDRVAMLKAGLTDPARPVGVFLFAGPTGTGKTELAKTLAEYLFGTAERLIRLDMSEFQTSDSVRKIIGADESEAQSLIQRVRKHPFAVVLLDEFEKAHWNVWDLFLQVFDDGRLTDAMGQTADFRHTIVILTSNLGATAHESAGVGFTPRADDFSQAQVLRAVSQSFRPEFVNRLDKVIVFRPLTRERMRGILQKELKRVLERRGLRNREWAVEWESSALEFLLDKGFSAAMGARPLKRAIDQHLLAPLAATLVEHRFPSGDQFLFVRSDGQAIQVEFVDPDAPEADASGPAPASPTSAVASKGAEPASPGSVLSSAILQPDGSRAEYDVLANCAAAIRARLDGAEWEQLRLLLSARMSEGDFWDDPKRHHVLARFALMDRVKAAAQTADALLERYRRGVRGHPGQYSRDLAGRLALQLFLVDHGIRDALLDAPVEVVVAIDPAMETGGDARSARQWCVQISEMYCQWAVHRRMQLTRVNDRRSELPLLVISGFGAHAVLSKEVGLHVLESEVEGPRGGGIVNRIVGRVRVAPTTGAKPQPGPDAETLTRALAAEPASAFVVRRYRFEPSPLVRDARRGWRSGRVREVMAGHFDLFSAGSAESEASAR
jgi:ATP-dependent Clp protease ATP-binding subunit ClpC